MSSTIYFGYPASQSNAKKVNVAPSLKEKGIELLRASPSSVQVICKPIVKSALWNIYIHHLSAILLSLSLGAPVSLLQEGFYVDSTCPNLLFINYPPLAIVVENLNQENRQWLIEEGFEEQEIRSTTTHIINNPSSDLLSRLASETCKIKFNKTCFAPYRVTNFKAISNFSMIRNLFSYLAMVLQVPIFDRELDLAKFRIISISDSGDTEAMNLDDTTAPEELDKDASPKGFEHRNMLKKLFSVSNALSTPQTKDTCSAAQFMKSSNMFAPNEFDQDNLLPGTLLRFVQELADDDSDGVPSFIQEYLFSSLGDSFTEQIDMFHELKSSWGVLKTTDVGHVLSHMVKCFRIAIDGQCGIKLIFDNGYYEGAIIQGSGYTIFTQNHLFSPCLPPDLNEDIVALETHGYAILEIKKILLKGKIPEKEIPDDFGDMNELRILLLQGRFNDDDRKNIQNLSRKLRFPHHRWAVNLGTIMKMLTAISKGTESITEDFPVGPEGIFSTDPVEITLSCFTTNGCPSFRHSSGVAIDLTTDKAPSPPKIDNNRKDKKPSAQINNGGWIFSVKRVEFSEAVADFHDLLKTKEARSIGSAASKGLGHYVLSGGNFEKVFHALKDCTKVNLEKLGVNSEITNLTVQGLKRAPLNTLDSPGASKKSRTFFG